MKRSIKLTKLLGSELTPLLFKNILQQDLKLLIGDRPALIILQKVRASDSLNRPAQLISSDLSILVVI